ncbi:unsaturated rhamnogalacturonyl hydrolase YesR-like isoform X2 [Gigantopelta aegis]|uniref:unsaturated rhamnogalacturonyl hydrolase YesR-like isoform X2 n=1 Tax=Gigantopelta aegis TaxID=1735272 RepID=UPI001B8878E5|nr:unsaturated rhamnogalacturonyl hydrolase YesR-like isoform X2 [Gigantopelta aegis]
MGLTLMARLGRALRSTGYVEFVANQCLLFNHYLQDSEDGLVYHGYNDADKHHSCCKWGRANGWSITASVEVLLALQEFKDIMPSKWSGVLKIFQTHASGMLRYQSTDGRWRQVVNESSTYLETSVTAMTLSALSRAVTQGWLDKEKYGPKLDLAWEGLQGVLQADGTVDGVCTGTGNGHVVHWFG